MASMSEMISHSVLLKMPPHICVGLFKLNRMKKLGERWLEKADNAYADKVLEWQKIISSK